MNWTNIIFEGAMGHVVPDGLKDQLLTEMLDRGHGPDMNFQLNGGPVHKTTIRSFDMGGMYFAGQPEEEFTVDGLTIYVPSDQFASILKTLKRLPLRYFADGSPYYKAKFWMHATVMHPKTYHETILKMEDMAEAAEAKAELFHTEWKETYGKKVSNK